jgi:Ulp1 family protease
MLHRLEPGTWLNDLLIDFFLSLHYDKNNSGTFFLGPTSLGRSLRNKAFKSLYRKAEAAQGEVVFPLGLQSHWILIRVKTQTPEVVIYDSLYDTIQEEVRKVICDLLNQVNVALPKFS